jgi:hypothetical protein
LERIRAENLVFQNLEGGRIHGGCAHSFRTFIGNDPQKILSYSTFRRLAPVRILASEKTGNLNQLKRIGRTVRIFENKKFESRNLHKISWQKRWNNRRRIPTRSGDDAKIRGDPVESKD